MDLLLAPDPPDPPGVWFCLVLPSSDLVLPGSNWFCLVLRPWF